jgi:hypothetical protein
MKKTGKQVTKSTLKIGLIAFGAMALNLSCDNDDTPVVVDEEEVITTMNVTLTATGASTITLSSKDLDGDGPNAPEISVSGNLAANTTYSGSIELLNETESPAEDITAEVAEEDDEHQFFFSASGAVTGTSYQDEDGDGNPIGLSFNLDTGDAGSGSIQITLRHEPKKPNNGTLADAGGETDIAQSFSVTVE